MLEVVDGSHDYLVVTGSRSRDTAYPQAIEKALSADPHGIKPQVSAPRHP